VTATTARILAYTLALVVATVLPGILGTFGSVYLVAAMLLDAVLCILAWRLWRDGTPARAGALFHWSLLYLALLFVAVAAGAATG
jgi:heme o synthase